MVFKHALPRPLSAELLHVAQPKAVVDMGLAEGHVPQNIHQMAVRFKPLC